MSVTCFNTSGHNESLTAIYKETKTTFYNCPKIIDPRCLAISLILLNNVAFAAETVSKNNDSCNCFCSFIGCIIFCGVCGKQKR